MSEQVWRLVWALPLVIALGVVLMLGLRRLGVGVGALNPTSGQPVLHNVTVLTEHSRLVVIEWEGARHAWIESTAQLTMLHAPSHRTPLVAAGWLSRWRQGAGAASSGAQA